jgi:hypothetical protein
VQVIGDRLGPELSDTASLVDVELLHLALDLVELAEEPERLLGDRALVVGPQIECVFQPIVDGVSGDRGRHFRLIVDAVSA